MVVNFLNKINKKIIPLAGISNKKTIQCKENVYFSIYNSDRYGFENPNNEWDKKQVEFFIIINLNLVKYINNFI